MASAAVQNSFSQRLGCTLIQQASLSDNSIVLELAKKILNENLPSQDGEIHFRRGFNQIHLGFTADGTLKYLSERTFFTEKTIGSKGSFNPERQFEWTSLHSGALGTFGDVAALCVATVTSVGLVKLIQKEIAVSAIRGTASTLAAVVFAPSAILAVGRAVKSLTEEAPALVAGAVLVAGAAYLYS